jgi:ParB-like chromosome segregation protein Spo0J
MRIVAVPLEKVRGWDRNPRRSEPEDLARLKAQILKLEQYKPLVAYQENGHYIVLGGNMRLKVLQDLGVKSVHLSIVKPKDEADKLAISISDNDRAGYYEEQALAELLWEHKDELDVSSLMIDLTNDVPLAQVIQTKGIRAPETDVYGSGKGQDPGPLICPSCGAVVEEKEIDGN